MPNRFLLPASPEPRPGQLTFLPRLTLEPAMARNGLFDGAWWPHSRDIAAELPDLITALGAHLGRILRVALDAAAWDDVPRSVTVNAEAVRIGWFASSPGTISLSCGLKDHCLLLVVPPETDTRTATAAMAGAAVGGNHTPAAELLRSPDTGQPGS
jgi:hypothetical protein